MPKTFLIMIFVLTGLVSVSAQCPTIKVVGPAGITNPGDDITFRVDVKVFGPKLSYAWAIDKGTIIKGQGTPAMTLTTIGLAGDVVSATVEIDGLPQHCENTASESAGISPKVECSCWDEWGELKPNEERGRLDFFFAELSNNPKDVGVIVLRIGSDDRLDPRNSRIKFVMKHIKYRAFDKNRIWFLLEPSEERTTRVYRIPPGGEKFPCEGCLLFKGEHL